jgi:hypothetical protein
LVMLVDVRALHERVCACVAAARADV